MRILALTTAAYFDSRQPPKAFRDLEAMQYFVRYGPAAAQKSLPRSLDSLLAWNDKHNEDVEALHQALGEDDLAASLVPWQRDGALSWLSGFIYAAPYVVHVGIFIGDMARRPSFRMLSNATGPLN